MIKKPRHVLGISGGKDSAALAIYLKTKYPNLDIEYYFCDTGKELDETKHLIEELEVFLGKEIKRLRAARGSSEDPFDHYHKLFGGYLPSSSARWCTKKLKLEPFEEFVGSDPVISYVAIRGDEEREGYISKKSNIQSIFPFRKNIWSEDVIRKVLSNENITTIASLYSKVVSDGQLVRILDVVNTPTSLAYKPDNKLNSLLDLGISLFNKVVFEFLKNTDYPLSKCDDFTLLDNEDVLVRDDIFQIFADYGVTVPSYYNKVNFQVNEKIGHYARSRSGCFFCFFQQKIEWVWLLENHPDLFNKAMKYEKNGYTWNQNESLAELSQPKRVKQIKEDYLKNSNHKNTLNSPYLIDILEETEKDGCSICFI